MNIALDINSAGRILRKLLLPISLFVLFLNLSVVSQADVDTKELQYRAIESVIEEWRGKYGMTKFKEEALGVTLKGLEAKYKGLVDKGQTLEQFHGLVPDTSDGSLLSEEEFEQLIIGMAGEWQDGHTNIGRKARNSATLGIHTAYIGGQLVVTGINEDLYVSNGEMKSIKVGDIIAEVDGVPVEELAKQFALYSQGATHNSRMGTGHAFILNRPYSRVRSVKNGSPVSVKFRRPEEKSIEFTNDYRWVETEDYVLDRQMFPESFGKPTPGGLKLAPYRYGTYSTVRSFFRVGVEGLVKGKGFNGQMIDVASLVNSEVKQELAEIAKKKAKAIVDSEGQAAFAGIEESNGDSVEAESSVLTPVSRIDAYVVNYKGKNIGVLRIPSFSPSGGVPAAANEIRFMARVIKYMNPMVDSMVLDTVSNGGGYVFLAMKFASMFASGDKPLESVDLDLRLSKTLTAMHEDPSDFLHRDPEDLKKKSNWAETMLAKSFGKKLEEMRRQGEKWSGRMAYMDSQYELADGYRYGKVFPREEALFEKPVLVLVDERNASGGDFFPGFLQSNERGIVFGAQTKGLGGPVAFGQNSFTNADLMGRCTMGFCTKPNGKPIENIGITPNILRGLTRADLMDGFKGWSTDALDAAHALANGKSYQQVIEASRTTIEKRLQRKQTIKKQKGLRGLTEKIESLISEEISELLASEDPNVLEAGVAKLEAFYKDVFAAIEAEKMIADHWALVSVPLPIALVKYDAILETLSSPAAINARLNQMKVINMWKPFPKSKKLMRSLSKGLDKVEAKPFVMGGLKQAEFGKACNIILR